nr:ABC transporter ATP-binding protein [Halobellus ruber]
MEAGDEETLVVLGPSGSGKTLLLETIAGFHEHDGTVTADGTDITDRAPEQREFGFVFQDYALFPHMTVQENVRYGARYRDSPRDAAELLSELGVAHLAERNPPTLSGGEKQRVALARALAVRPDVLLLDEPLAALDVPTRQSLRDDLVDVLADVTSIYVTHNRTTARAVADRIVVMADGQIVQRGTPEAVFERPESPMVASFTGSNVIDLGAAPTVRSLLDGHDAGDTDVRGNGSAERVAIRPEAIRFGDTDGDLRATVRRVVREDATHRVTLAFDDVTVEAFADSPPTVGDDVAVALPRDRIHPC